MRNLIIKRINTIFAFYLICLWTTNAYSQENIKLAQTGFQFLSVVSDARGASMAEAMTSLKIGSSALFFNPAGMSEMNDFFELSASSNQWIADIKHYTLSMAINPFEGRYGVLGFSLQSVRYGDFWGTRVSSNDDGYEDTGIFSISAIAVGVGYSKQLTDQFCFGGQIRWAHQDLGNSYIPINIRPDTANVGYYVADTSRTSNKLSPLIFDFGTQFKTKIKSLVFGMSIRNFSNEVKYASEGFQAPLVFTIGISMNVLDIFDINPAEHCLNMCVDASHLRDHPEQLKIGMEYRVMNVFALRGGYIFGNDLDNVSYGVGVSKFGFTFDYAYTPFGIFKKVQRMTARFSF